MLFGSSNDAETYTKIQKDLKGLGVTTEVRCLSAHRTPDEITKVISPDNFKVVVAGAGLSAALPGVVASTTMKPVIGVPCDGAYQGLDAMLSVMQIPSGIPVLGVGVGCGSVAAQNAAKMLENFTGINLIGDPNEAAYKECEDMLAKFDIIPEKIDEPASDKVNISFVSLDEAIPESEALVIYVPVLLADDNKAGAALNVLKHSTHGLWVGLNNGKNAALGAIQILNLTGNYTAKLVSHRDQQKEKVIKADSEVEQ